MGPSEKQFLLQSGKMREKSTEMFMPENVMPMLMATVLLIAVPSSFFFFFTSLRLYFFLIFFLNFTLFLNFT